MAKPSGTWCFINHPQDGTYSTAQYPYYKDTNNEYHSAGTATWVINEGKIGNNTVEALLMDPTYSYQWNRQNYLKNTGELQWLPIGTAAYEYDSVNSHLTYQNYRINTEQGQLQIDGIGYKPQRGANSNENQYNIADHPLTYLNYIGSDREWLGIYNNLDDIENYDTDSFLILKLKPQLCFVKNGKPINPNEQKAYGWKSDMQTLDNLSFDFDDEKATVQFLYHIHNQDFNITQEIKHSQWKSELNLTTGSATLDVTVYENQKSSITLPKLWSCPFTPKLWKYDHPAIEAYDENNEYAFGIGNKVASHTIRYNNTSLVGPTAYERKQLPMIGWQFLPFGRIDIGSYQYAQWKEMKYMLEASSIRQFNYYKNSTWESLPYFSTSWMWPNDDSPRAQWLYNYYYQLTPYFLLPVVDHHLDDKYTIPYSGILYGIGSNPSYPPAYLHYDAFRKAPALDKDDDRYWNSHIHHDLQWLIYKKPTDIQTLTALYTEFQRTNTTLTPTPITWLNNTLCTWSVVAYNGPSWWDDDYKYIFYTFYTQQPQEQQYRYYVWKIKLINE